MPLSGCGEGASHCGGFSRFRTQAPGCFGFSSHSTRAQQVWLPGSGAHRLNSFGAWAQQLCSMWDLPRSGIKPVSPALAGGIFTTEPPRKPPSLHNLTFLFQLQNSLSCFGNGALGDLSLALSSYVFVSLSIYIYIYEFLCKRVKCLTKLS